MKLEPIDKQGPALLLPQDGKARRRSNTAPTSDPGITAEELAAGVTLEQLQALPVPVLAYQTQITIHGQFPKVSPLCAGYHFLTRNANGSLGVRYAAIDAAKKRTIARAARLDKASPWHAILDSRGLTLQRHVATPREGRDALAAIPSGIYGGAGLFRCPVSGYIYAVVNVGAVRAADLWPVVAYFAPALPTPEALATREAEIEAEQQARRDEAAAEGKRRAEAAAEALEAARVEALAAGVQPLPATFDPGAGESFRVLSVGYDGKPGFRHYALAKRGPYLCMIREGRKGRKVEEHHRAAWRKAAAAGLVFLA